MQNRAFHAVEHEAWSQRAGIYDELFADVSIQAIPYFLGCIADWAGKRHLDVACGTGHLVAATAKLGANSQGVDFAQPMIEAAQANYPGCHFDVADAGQLPHEAETVDVVNCAFGLPHMAVPQAACDEAYRVLKPGGCFAFTLWFGAERGGEMHAIVESALQAHAIDLIALPKAWTTFRFAHPDDCAAIVERSGFNPPALQTLPIACRSEAAQDFIDIIDRLSVRTAAIIAAQPQPIQAGIRQQILFELEAHRRGDVIELAWPALLTVAQKAG